MTAVESDPALAAAALSEAGRLAEAEAAYRALASERPDDAAIRIALADLLADTGRSAEAATLYRQVIDAAPDAVASADAYDGLAAVLQEAGDVPNAVAASLRAVALRGDADDAYRLGYTLEQMGRPADADAAYRLAGECRPAFAEAHAKVASFLMRRGKVADGAARYAVAADADPTIAEVHCNLANARRLNGDEEGALRSIRKAIDLKPGMAAAHNVLGTIMRDRRRPADALAAFRRAIELDPKFAEGVSNWASVLESVGRVAEAAVGFEQAIALAPAVPQYHERLGLNRLLRGDLAGGWVEVDWRRLDRRNPAGRPFPRPFWNGGPLANSQTILLSAEPGLADTIQFLRYAPLVAGRGGRVVVECPPELVDLAGSVAGVSEVVPFGQPLPAFDVHCPLMTLPLVFNTRLETIPAAVPYVGISPAHAAAWAERLPSADGHRRVGLIGSADAGPSGDRTRSINPSRLAPLAAVPGIIWVALSPTAPPPPALKPIDLTADLHGLADTAALIAQLDLVVAIDSTVAHLSAALGKPTWILLPAVADWRWMQGRADSPWYPTARLFRQPTPGDWAAVIADVVAALGV
jgi:tetratricopeptide (TPR) repeat protein